MRKGVLVIFTFKKMFKITHDHFVEKPILKTDLVSYTPKALNFSSRENAPFSNDILGKEALFSLNDEFPESDCGELINLVLTFDMQMMII